MIPQFFREEQKKEQREKPLRTLSDLYLLAQHERILKETLRQDEERRLKEQAQNKSF